MVRLAVVFYGLLMALALAWAAFSGESLVYADAAARERGIRPLRDAGLGLSSAALVIGLSHLWTTRTGSGERLARALADLLGPLGRRECVALAALSGVAEEALFRGALQPQVGWVAASLLFGLAHFAPRRDLLPWTGFSVLAGFWLGGLFAWTGNLVAPVAAHFLVNAVNLRLLARGLDRPAP